MSELYDNARKSYESKQAKIEEMKQNHTEDSDENRAERRQKFKTVQSEFVKYLTQVGTELVQKCLNDVEYTKSFIDVLKFNPPPKRNESQNVYFQDLLLIELMEGPQSLGYEAFFKELGTDTTLSMLQESFKPFKVYYGYFPRFGGNIIQVRWDDTVPGWALDNAQRFEKKKAMSRKNRDRTSHREGGNTGGRRRPFRPSPVADLFRFLSHEYRQAPRRVGYSNNRGNRSPSPQSFRGGRSRDSHALSGRQFRQGYPKPNYRRRDNFNNYSEFKHNYSRVGNENSSTNNYDEVEA